MAAQTFHTNTNHYILQAFDSECWKHAASVHCFAVISDCNSSPNSQTICTQWFISLFKHSCMTDCLH